MDKYVNREIGSIGKLDNPPINDELFKILTENVASMLFVAQQGRYVYVNPALATTSGYTAEEFYQMKRVWEIVAPEHQPLVKKRALALERGEEVPAGFEFLIINKSGEARWIEYRGAVINIEGTPAILGSCIDITDRKRAEEELQQSEEKYRLLIESSHDIIYTMNPDGIFTFVSPVWTLLLGHPISEVYGKPFQQFVHSDDIARCQAFLHSTLETGQRQSGVEYRVLHLNGTWRWHSTNAVPLKGAAGTIIGFEGIASDISDRKLAEEALRANEEQHRLMVSQMPQGLAIHEVICDESGKVFDYRFLDVNPSFENMTGLKRENIIGKTVLEIMPETESYWVEKYGHVAMTGELLQYENYSKELDRYYEVVAYSPQAQQFAVIISDISERKKLEDHLLNSEKRYKSLAEDMEALICIFLPDGTLTYVNRVCCEYFQKNQDELLGHSFLEFLPDETIRQEVAKNYRSLTIEQAIHTHEQPVITLDGSKIWQRWTNRAIFNDKTELIYYQSIGIDITDRKRSEEELQAANEQMEAAFEEITATEEELRTQYQQLQVQEQALRDSEQRLTDIINFLPDPTMIINNAGQIMVWNQAAEEMTGVKAIDILGKGNYEHALPFYGARRPILVDLVLLPNQQIEQEYQAISRDKKSIMAEAILPVLNGKTRFFSGKATPLYNQRGNIVGAIESLRDITEHKKVQATLEETQQQMKQVIELLPDATLVIDREGQVVFWNQAMEKMTGVTQEQIIGRGNYEYSIPFYGERRPILIDLALMSNREYHAIKEKYDFIHQESDTLIGEVYVPKTYGGKGAYLLGSASKLYDLQGNIVGAIQSIRDITDRKDIEKALVEEKELLKTTLLSIGDGVISTDKNGRVNLINKVAEQLIGWTQIEAFSKPLEEVFNTINEFTQERCENPVREVLDTGKTIEIANHTMLISKAGIARPIEDSAAPIKDEAGKINGVVLVFRDFTEKKDRQEKIAYLSYHDQLTGLYNRRFFEEELKRLDTERNLPITLVMADVNGLKLTNDAFGHLAGDKLLIKVAEIMEKECRTDDIIARIGGDEFMILLPKTEAEKAKKIVGRINASLAQEKVDSIILSVSFGWETKREATEEMKSIFKQAEDHMYRHKLSASSSMRNKTIKVIIGTLYEKNKREEQHSQRVSELCASLATALDLGPDDVAELRTAGLMHDIGKIALEEMILNKPGQLNNTEWLQIKRHPETGYRILSSVNEFSQLATYVLAHHERWDGKGYPKGLIGEEIPLQARILAVADTYDAMTSDRPYRQALSEEIVVEEIKGNAGIQFDPLIVRVLLEKVLVNSSDVFSGGTRLSAQQFAEA